ncbi:hypothetical protein D9Q98_005373 [Chlorella vulgaris]|uniref:Uncharacterized protein n=1 Tax=Chlorella vulgaris TaxID=3077 RepID=A0A9D4YVS9_CHLVU|nr:hypothetical protein D9Q98_005373 [Chlorella vulgaris]
MTTRNWKPWAGAALLAWGGFLQWDMRRLRKDPRFKEKFPEVAVEEGGEDERRLSVRVKSGGERQDQ